MAIVDINLYVKVDGEWSKPIYGTGGNTLVKQTKSGLLLPAGYQEKEDILSGYILKCGPGYALPNMEDAESWNPEDHTVRYLPLQVQAGDLAIFMQKNAVEIKYEGEKYYIVPQSAILLVERDTFE